MQPCRANQPPNCERKQTCHDNRTQPSVRPIISGQQHRLKLPSTHIHVNLCVFISIFNWNPIKTQTPRIGLSPLHRETWELLHFHAKQVRSERSRCLCWGRDSPSAWLDSPVVFLPCNSWFGWRTRPALQRDVSSHGGDESDRIGAEHGRWRCLEIHTHSASIRLETWYKITQSLICKYANAEFSHSVT